ncbi:MAG: DUF3570 domain-containing protein [Proteobacteria bacterium]|nr:DUF3570 domain-containing protein [Pseudomonadota bacterium]
MRLQLIRTTALALVLAAIGARVASAEDTSAMRSLPMRVPMRVPVPVPVTPAPAPPPASDRDTPPGMTDPDAVSPDDLRDVLGEPAPPDAAVTGAASEPVTGTVRIGNYHDSDQTSVLRLLGAVAHTWGRWMLNTSVTVDAVTSASVDVRASPALSQVDVVTSASGTSSSSGGQMTDTRYQVTGGAGWKDSAGHGVNLTSAVAMETDYESVSGGINGSYDLNDRTVTLLGGVTLTDNWISSVLDPSLHRKMFGAAWSAGVALVLTRDDALRLRYDGKSSDGYQASPYRTVRFGDWTAVLGERQITFANTLGPVGGLAERLPGIRISHAAVAEWVHALVTGVGLHPELRVGHDSWGITSLSAAIDLRIAQKSWRLQTGYRFYRQSRADFFETKYVQDASMYTTYTSDKELGSQTGHLLRFDVSHVLIDADSPTDSRLMVNLQIAAAWYRYPGFVLLPARDSVFASIGLAWEL